MKDRKFRVQSSLFRSLWIITHKVNDICYNIVTAPEMESTAPPQKVPVDRLCLYRMPAAPVVLLPQTESRAAAQAEDDDDDFMEYIPMVPQQQPQLLPHQPPPLEPPPGPPPPGAGFTN
jgi:hypothetical protein